MPGDQVKARQAGQPQILCQLPKVRMLGCLGWVCGQPGCQLQALAILQQVEISLSISINAVTQCRMCNEGPCQEKLSRLLTEAWAWVHAGSALPCYPWHFTALPWLVTPCLKAIPCCPCSAESSAFRFGVASQGRAVPCAKVSMT